MTTPMTTAPTTTTGTTRLATAPPATRPRSTAWASGASILRTPGLAAVVLGAAGVSVGALGVSEAAGSAAAGVGAAGAAAGGVGSRVGSVSGEHLGVEALHELAQELRRHVGHDPAAELCDLARHLEIGVDADRGGVAVGCQRCGDGRVRVALTARVAALGADHDPVRRLVRLDDARRPPCTAR